MLIFVQVQVLALALIPVPSYSSASSDSAATGTTTTAPALAPAATAASLQKLSTERRLRAVQKAVFQSFQSTGRTEQADAGDIDEAAAAPL